MTNLTGSCHCENISYIYRTNIPLNEIEAKVCNCSFCTKHSSASISDPAGELEIFIREGFEPIKYIFNLKTAKFLICRTCGCYVASTVANENKIFSAINIKLLDDDCKNELKIFKTVAYKHETRASRRERLLQSWTPTLIHRMTLLEQKKINTVEGFDSFAKKFQDCSLPKNKWTHEAHFVIALWLILRHGLEEARSLARDGIKKYNLATGVANTEHDGYHETITMLYLTAVNDFIKNFDAKDEINILSALLKSEIIDKEYPLKFYSPEVLFSKEARLNWMEPDLLKLPTEKN